MTTILDGNGIAKEIMNDLKIKFQKYEEKNGRKASMRLILVGNDEGARIYSEAKLKRANKLNVDAKLLTFSSDTSEDEIVDIVKNLSSDDAVNGIMVENPLPKSMDFYNLVDQIPFYKDIDGTSARNQGLIVNKREFLTPATALASVKIMEEYGLKGNVTIVNRSQVVGRPLINMLLNRDYTVSVCHSKTRNLMEYTRNADIVVAAIGKPLFFGEEYFTENSNIVDVGINYIDNKIVGDVDFGSLNGHVASITPVPGGVGPVTASLIFDNLYRGCELQTQLAQTH